MESYQFIKQIGSFNNGDAWLVKCPKTRNKYVLKHIDLHQASKRDQRAAYIEAKFLANLKHPNIVTYLDSFYNSKGNLFIVMCYCECEDFHTFIQNQNGVYFKERKILNWFVQICMGLKYLHDKGILHRDLKTQNIFLTKNKLVKIGELGIPQVLKAAEEMSIDFRKIPFYMNPEVFTGKAYELKTDVWALGCCIYEISALAPVFRAQDMHRLNTGKLPSIPAIYSSEFSTVISSMLSPNPDERPSVTELLLNEFIRKFIIHSLKESPPVLSSSSRSCSRSTSSLADKSRPLSRLFASEGNYPKHEVCNKTENLISEIMIRTIPDSNGNGDGNDNSQHQANHTPVLSSIKYSKFKCTNDSISVKKQVTDHHQKLKENNLSEIVSTASSNSSRSSSSSDSLKMRSERSFTLLNNLCYTMRQSRLESWQSTISGFLPNIPKVTYSYGDNPPKSADELYFQSNRKQLLKRCSLSAFETHSHKRFENIGQLPNIRNHESQISTVSAVNKNELNLPNLENASVSCHRNEHKTMPWECASKDDHFDKLLLQNIIECSDPKQDGFVKSIGCSHRREILKLNNISSSTSIV